MHVFCKFKMHVPYSIAGFADIFLVCSAFAMFHRHVNLPEYPFDTCTWELRFWLFGCLATVYYNWEWLHFIMQSLVLMTLVTLSLSAPQVLLPTTQTNILRMDGVEGGWIFHYTRYCPRKVLQRAFLTCILGPDFSFKNAKNWTGTWIHPKIMEACIFWTGSLGRKTCIFPRVNAYFLHVSATSEQKYMVHSFCGSGAGKTHAFSWQPQIWQNMHFPGKCMCFACFSRL